MLAIYQQSLHIDYQRFICPIVIVLKNSITSVLLTGVFFFFFHSAALNLIPPSSLQRLQGFDEFQIERPTVTVVTGIDTYSLRNSHILEKYSSSYFPLYTSSLFSGLFWSLDMLNETLLVLLKVEFGYGKDSIYSIWL